MTLQVIHTVGSLGMSAGGPSRTVPALCRHVEAADRSIHVEIVTTSDPRYGANVAYSDLEIHAAAGGNRRIAVERLLAARLRRAMASGDPVLLHDHGQWLPLNRHSASKARRHGLQRIVSPRGMLTPWSLNHKSARKKVAWLLFARGDFFEANVLHATSQQEADEFRALGARQPIAVIPNGVDGHPLALNQQEKTKTMVFLSRLHPKKGVAELVAAWREVGPAGWRLVLAGPDEAQMLDSLKLSDSEGISYVGEVDGPAKWRLLGSAAATVLPSYSENFGVVVAESLMAGTPVIATEGTPWRSLNEHDCGWWIPMAHRSLVTALRTATNTDFARLASMGHRGHDLVISQFAWPAIGAHMARVYRWLAGDFSMPECVQVA